MTRPLGQMLIDRGLITEDQLRIALTEQRVHREPLGQLLVRLDFVAAGELSETLGEALGKRSINLSSIIADPVAVGYIPESLARSYKALPIAFHPASNTVTVAFSDVTDLRAIDHIQAALPDGVLLDSVLASDDQIAHCLDQFYDYQLSIEDILTELETEHGDELAGVTDGSYQHPIVRLVNTVLTDAVIKRASDVHLEPEEAFIRIRYRIDGVLNQIICLHKSYWASIVVRLKILSGMNIAESRTPQDGQFRLTISGRPINFRASVQPTIHGENIALRILDRQQANLTLQSLGMSDATAAQLRIMMARPEGIILVTGPTGCGKSTTLYSLLRQINDESINIMTMEDPVEHPMSRVRQTSMTDTNKITFADGIRAIMRQDPDVILIGEIRDSDTAEMAFRAAMTGHQVFSTLHANSAIGAIPRLIDIGISPEILTGNIIGIVGQRLVRKLCPQCKFVHTLSQVEKQLLGLRDDEDAEVFKPGPGCEHCQQQGYVGRLALMEALRFDDELDELISQRASTTRLKTYASSNNFSTMAQDGIRRVLDGTTSLDELSRVVNLTDRL